MMLARFIIKMRKKKDLICSKSKWYQIYPEFIISGGLALLSITGLTISDYIHNRASSLIWWIIPNYSEGIVERILVLSVVLIFGCILHKYNTTLRNKIIETNKSYNLLESIFKATPDMLLVLDKNKNVVKSNLQHEAQVNCYNVLRGEDGTCQDCKLDELFDNKIPTVKLFYDKGICEVRSFPVLDCNGNSIYVVKYIRDITELTRMADELKQTQKEVVEQREIIIKERNEKVILQDELGLLSTAVQQTSEGVVILDKDFKAVYANSAFENLLGYTKSEFLGEEPFSFFKTPETTKLGRREVIKTKLDDSNTWSKIISVRSASGKPITVSITVWCVHEENGDVSGYICLIRDITKEDIIERRLRISQKMEAVGSLAGGIAHDFNNLLSIILTYSELCLLASRDENVRDKIRKIMISAERGSDLVKRILKFSRQNGYEKQPLLIIPLVTETLKLVQISAPQNVETRQTYDIIENTAVMASLSEMQQIIMNVCSNAYYAMKGKGGVLDIRVDATTIGDEHKEALSLTKAGEYIRIVFKDTGTGISKAIMDKIFDPFFTTKPQGEGTGMGLSMIHGILRSYDGDIIAESEEGFGTTITVYIPSYSYKNGELKKEDIGIKFGNERIMLVDDEANIVDSYGQLLQMLGYTVYKETSSKKALEFFADRPDSIDIFILDLSMPEMDGMELSRELLKIRQVPIILCTGFSEIDLESKALSLGIAAFIHKPIITKDISILLRKLLDREKNEAKG